MRILVIGGTVFLGRSIVESAIERGHEVTLFNRGRSDPSAFPSVEHIVGDRDGDIGSIAGGSWDVVIDTCGYLPRVVRASAELKVAPWYVFVSSISAYAEMDEAGIEEDAPLGVLDDPRIEEVNGATYGPLKAACEKAVQDIYVDQATVVRPGLIVGPRDPTDRFTYWPRRISEGGRILAPAPPDRQVQFIDVRDLGEWIVHVAENHLNGTFNATGPVPPLTMADLINSCLRSIQSDDADEQEIVWVAEAHLLDHEVGPWMELPLWMPTTAIGMRGTMSADVSKAVAAGLKFRPTDETVADTFTWDRERGMPVLGAGLDRAKEAAVLSAWRETVR